MIRRIAASFLIATAISASGMALAQSTAETFEIGGIRLGMTRDAAHTAARAAGYVEKQPTGSLAARYQDEVNRVRARFDPSYQPPRATYAPNLDRLQGSNGQSLEVNYVYTPTGPQVDRVIYQVKAEVVPFAEVERSATAKFGRPSMSFKAADRTVRWCEKRCDYTTPTGQDSVTLEGGVGRPVYLILSDGDVLRRLVKSLTEAEAAKLSGKGAKPAI